MRSPSRVVISAVVALCGVAAAPALGGSLDAVAKARLAADAAKKASIKNAANAGKSVDAKSAPRPAEAKPVTITAPAKVPVKAAVVVKPAPNAPAPATPAPGAPSSEKPGVKAAPAKSEPMKPVTVVTKVGTAKPAAQVDPSKSVDNKAAPKQVVKVAPKKPV